MRPRPFSILFIVAALAGLVFASFATYDFVEHLDRQVHGIHCSFIPGLTDTDASATSGCHITMMSAYSSVFRASMWGGLPVSLPAMAVFAFLLFRGLDLVLNRREDERGATVFLVAAACLPFLTSLGMGYLSLVTLGAACKLCIGIYTSSTLCLVSAIGIWRSASAPRLGEELGIVGEPIDEETNPGFMGHALSFGQGVGFVAIPALVYCIVMPDYSGYIGACGALVKPEDTYGTMVALDENTGKASTIEVFDPLCPACKAFEKRLAASGLDKQLNRKAMMFPLDNTCNWMVGSTLHPGACTVSEAVLCAGDKADVVIAWAFENQDAIREATAADPEAAARMVAEKFPDLKSCLGSSAVRSKLNKSLRWAVTNQLQVLTPQVYIDGVKLCDEDTDLGMEFALTRMLAQHAAGTLSAKKEGTP